MMCFKRQLFIILISFNNPIAWAAESLPNTPIQHSADVTNILAHWKQSNPALSGKFHLSTAETDQVVALAGLGQDVEEIYSNLYSRHCQEQMSPEEKEDKKKSIGILISISHKSQPFRPSVFQDGVVDEYYSFMLDQLSSGNYAAFDIYNISTLVDHFQSTNPMVDLSTKNFSDRVKTLRDYANSITGVQVPEDIFLREYAVFETVNNGSSWRDTFGAFKDSMSSEDKLKLVSRFGGIFSSHYNYARKEVSDNQAITAEQLLLSAKNGTPGGVCRDIALTQTQMLEELGFKNNYVLAYHTPLGGHAIAMTRDPATGKYYKFNYSDMQSTDARSGSEALFQSGALPENGLKYRIYNTKGEPVVSMPTGMQQLLRDAAGATQRTFMPTNYSINKAVMTKDLLGAQFSATTFYGQTSAGQRVDGLALSVDSKGKYADFQGSVSKSYVDFQSPGASYEQTQSYVTATSTLHTPKISVGGARVSIALPVEVETLHFDGQVKHQGSIVQHHVSGTETWVRGGVGYQVNLPVREDLSLSHSAQTSRRFDYLNVSAAAGVEPVKDQTTIGFGAKYLTERDREIIMDATVQVADYGNSLSTGIQYRNPSTSTIVRASTVMPLDKDIPSFLPGGQRSIAIAGERTFSNDLKFTLQFERVDKKDSTVKASLEKKF